MNLDGGLLNKYMQGLEDCNNTFGSLLAWTHGHLCKWSWVELTLRQAQSINIKPLNYYRDNFASLLSKLWETSDFQVC